MIAYKALRVVSADLISAGTNARDWIIKYPIDRVVKPDWGKLFVFETPEQARLFYYELWIRKQIQIWECEVDKAQELDYILNDWPYTAKLSDGWYEFWTLEFWALRNDPKTFKEIIDPRLLTKTPKGTLVCESLKLTRRLP